MTVSVIFIVFVHEYNRKKYDTNNNKPRPLGRGIRLQNRKWALALRNIKHKKMKTLLNIFLLFILICSFHTEAYCQPFSLDETFESSYTFMNHFNNNEVGGINTIIELVDGSIRLSGGFIDPYYPNLSTGMLKLFPNGNYDAAFYFYGGDASGKIFRYQDYLYYIGQNGTTGRVDIQSGVVDSVFRDNKDSSNWGGGNT